MNRYLNHYDLIFCDIDDTLIHGFWTDLMRHTWNIFKSPKLSNALMFIQLKLHLYKINKKLAYILSHTKAQIIFLTARAETDYTCTLLQQVLPGVDFDLMELGSSTPHYDKLTEAQQYIQEFSLQEEYAPKCCIFDDNTEVRRIFGHWGIDAIDPTNMIETLIG